MNKKIFLLAVMALFSCGLASANIKQVKVYQEAYPDAEKPKCIACHTAEKPKKEGDHELNDYGKKVDASKTGEAPTADDFKKAGPISA